MYMYIFFSFKSLLIINIFRLLMNKTKYRYLYLNDAPYIRIYVERTSNEKRTKLVLVEKERERGTLRWTPRQGQRAGRETDPAFGMQSRCTLHATLHCSFLNPLLVSFSLFSIWKLAESRGLCCSSLFRQNVQKLE